MAIFIHCGFVYSDAVPASDRQPSRLLGYPHWETRDADEAALALSREHRSLRQETPTALSYLMSSNTAELEWLTFSSIWLANPQKTWAEADGRHYMLAFWMEGANDYRFHGCEGTVAAGEGLLSAPYSESYWKSNIGRDVIAVRIPSAMLLKEAENLSGRPLPHRLEAAGLLQKRGPIWRLVDRFLRRLESGLFKKPSLLRREHQRRLIEDVVLATPHNIPLREERLHNLPWLHQLRYGRAIEHLQAHLTDATSIGDLAAAANTTAKGLQRAFRYRHETWLHQRWKMRMEQARRDLLAPEEHTTVSSVCEKYGLHPGRFAKEYFHMFGEYPADILRLGRLGHKI